MSVCLFVCLFVDSEFFGVVSRFSGILSDPSGFRVSAMHRRMQAMSTVGTRSENISMAVEEQQQQKKMRLFEAVANELMHFPCQLKEKKQKKKKRKKTKKKNYK